MKIESSDHVPFPVETVFSLLRDRLSEVVPFLPNVNRVEDISREELGEGKVRIVRRWYGKGEVPKVAQKFLKPEMLSWVDTALWDETTHLCTWDLSHDAFKEQFRCSGKTSYKGVGEGETRIELVGDLSIDLRNIPGVPRMLARSVSPAVEKVLVNMITPNLSNLPKGLRAYLSQRGGA